MRIALLWFAHLATGFEGHGFGAAEDPLALEDDERCLGNVVKLLLDHRKAVLKRRQKAVAQELVNLVTPLYAEYKSDPSLTRDDLRTRMTAMLEARGVPYPKNWVTMLAIEREELERTPRHAQGPQETASYVVCERLLGIYQDAVRKGSKEVRERQLLLSLFGVTPSRAMAKSYVEQVFAWVPPETIPQERAIAEVFSHDEAVLEHTMQRLVAAAEGARRHQAGEHVDIADIPGLERFATAPKALRESLLNRFLAPLSAHDPDVLRAIATAPQTAEVATMLVDRWRGRVPIRLDRPPVRDTPPPEAARPARKARARRSRLESSTDSPVTRARGRFIPFQHAAPPFRPQRP